MLIGGIIGFFKTLIGGVVKVSAWLLFALGLWLPSLYLIVFLIACAFTGTPLSDVMQTFVVGMIFSAAAGIVLSYYIEKYKRSRKQVVPKSLREERREKKRAEKLARLSERETDAAEEPETTSQSRNGYEEPPVGINESFAVGVAELPVSAVQTPAETPIQNAERKTDTPTERVYADESELRRKYFDSGSAVSYKDYNYDYESAAQKRLKAINEDDERPLVFRSRRDENVYIYEYEDRLQIYRRTRGGGMRLTDIIERRRK